MLKIPRQLFYPGKTKRSVEIPPALLIYIGWLGSASLWRLAFLPDWTKPIFPCENPQRGQSAKYVRQTNILYAAGCP